MIRLSLDALEALDAIDRAGSFAGAAIHLRKAQSWDRLKVFRCRCANRAALAKDAER